MNSFGLRKIGLTQFGHPERLSGPQNSVLLKRFASLYRRVLFLACGLSFVIANECLFTTASAQSLSPAPVAIALPPNLPPSTIVPLPKPPFMIRSYEGAPAYEATAGTPDLSFHGKCLDYGAPPATPAPLPIGAGAAGVPGLPVDAVLLQNVSMVASTAAPVGPSVFLNDCSQAHSIVVEELNNGRHEVILHAGSQVIGIVQSTGISQPLLAAAAASTTSLTPAGTYQLQLLTPPVVAPPAATTPTQAVNDVFALDGDSIILASSRCMDPSACSPPPTQLVVQLQNGRSDNGTPLVVAPRNLTDSEFWDLLATDHLGAYPTSGFWAVSNVGQLLNAVNQINQIALQNNGTAWGNVVVVTGVGSCIGASGAQPRDWAGNPILQCINLTDLVHDIQIDENKNKETVSLDIPTGVTLRGDRRGTNLGPLLLGQYTNNPTGNISMIQVGSYVRITGLRLEGPTGTTAPWSHGNVHGIFVYKVLDPEGAWSPATEVIVDHNELFAWENGAVRSNGGVSESVTCVNGQPGVFDPNTGFFFPAAPASLDTHVERNFVHHNPTQSAGYGVNVSYGGGATVLGNTFLYNRHAISGNESYPTQQYSASDNLVLSDAPSYSNTPLQQGPEQDFDMHGTLNVGGEGYGGWAGYHIEIAWNTFLGENRENFELRGLPCAEPDSFHNNVSQQSKDKAIKEDGYGGGDPSYYSSSDSELTISGNEWSVENPTNFLGVGDFDGDGVQDLFLATGTTWFYSPGGVTDWRYLSGEHTGNMQSLLLGDFDGDGRTDVVTIKDSSLIVSWGGISDWQVLNTLPAGATIADLAVGDFNGDGHADILYTTGTYWYVSSGGSGPFNHVNSSSFRVPSLRFGHFSICGSNKETDVFAIVSGKWQVTCGALGNWQPLPVSLTDSLSGLYVADFDGDGNADIAQLYSFTYEGNDFTSLAWRFSYGATQGWLSHTIVPTSSCPAFGSLQPALLVAGIGSFDGNPGADLLLWASGSTAKQLCIVPNGIRDAQLQSRQEMR